ncbi:MAG: hypothetical protein U1E76_02615 [Planctomycetota bacterium]
MSRDRLEEAAELAERALNLNENWWTLEWNARVQHGLGNTEAAPPLLKKALVLTAGTSSPPGPAVARASRSHPRSAGAAEASRSRTTLAASSSPPA